MGRRDDTYGNGGLGMGKKKDAEANAALELARAVIDESKKSMATYEARLTQSQIEVQKLKRALADILEARIEEAGKADISLRIARAALNNRLSELLMVAPEEENEEGDSED